MDAAKLEHLKDMMNAPDYKENLGTLIRYGTQGVILRGALWGKQETCKNRQILSR